MLFNYLNKMSNKINEDEIIEYQAEYSEIDRYLNEVIVRIRETSRGFLIKDLVVVIPYPAKG